MDDQYIVEIVEPLLLLRNYILFKVSVHNSIVGALVVVVMITIIRIQLFINRS